MRVHVAVAQVQAQRVGGGKVGDHCVVSDFADTRGKKIGRPAKGGAVHLLRMNAVSLSEAWNDPPPPPPAPPAPKANAARRVAAASPAPEASEDLPDERAPPPRDDAHEAMKLKLMADLLEEMHALRVDQARRCTVYLSVAGVLFALLFMYIDRLQRRLAHLSTPPSWSMPPVPTHRPMPAHAPMW